MRNDGADWRWLSDPQPDAPGFVARALSAQKRPSFMYRTTVWALVRDATSNDDASAGAATLRLHYESDALLLRMFTWLHVALWTVRRARMKRRVEAIAVGVTELGGEVAGAERLLSEAATVIDAAVSK